MQSTVIEEFVTRYGFWEISRGSLNPVDILESLHPYIKDKGLADQAAAIVSRDPEGKFFHEEAEYVMDEVYAYLNGACPEGIYFGSCEESQASIGFFYEDERGV